LYYFYFEETDPGSKNLRIFLTFSLRFSPFKTLIFHLFFAQTSKKNAKKSEDPVQASSWNCSTYYESQRTFIEIRVIFSTLFLL